MAKIYGLFGAMTGKTADVVMAVRNGEQIIRKYQPIVANPSTPAQVEARAKLKLMSQLSAVMGPYIAIPKRGAVSSRNLFTKKNYGLTTYTNNTADITLASVQLTDSVVGAPSLNANRAQDAQTTANVRFTRPLTDVNRVVYAAFVKGLDSKLRAVNSIVITEPGPNSAWSASFEIGDSAAVILAFGVRDNTENARAIFGNLTALSTETVAKLIVSRTLTETDVTLTETVGVEVAPLA